MDSCPLLLLWELPSPTRRRNPLWGRSPAQREMLKPSHCILHLLTNISWHPILLCWKQSSLPSLILYEASHHPRQSWAPLNQNRAWGAAPAKGGHNVLHGLDLHSLEWLVVVLPLTVPVLWHKKVQDFPHFPLHFKSKAQKQEKCCTRMPNLANRSCTMSVCSLGLCYPSAVLLTLFVLPELIFSHFQEIMCIY